MGVFKRGNIYWYEFVFNGVRIRQSTKQGNKNTARQMEGARRARLAMGEVGIRKQAPPPTVKAFAPRFLAAVETNTDKPRTVKMYTTAVNGLLAFSKLAESPVDRVDEALVEAFKQWRSRAISSRGTLYKTSTINRELAALRRLLSVAHEWKLIGRIPRVRQMRDAGGREFIVSPELERVYFGAAEPEYHDFALLLLDAGLRVGEVLTLDWRDVHLKPATGSELGYVTVRAENAKNRKARHVPLTPRLSEALDACKPRRSGFVFRHNGEPLNHRWVQVQHDKLRDTIELPPEFVPHSLRHTYGTRLGEAGADAFTIMRLMGHSSITVSAKYVHPTPDALERAVQRMADRQGEASSEGPHNIPTPDPKNRRKLLN